MTGNIRYGHCSYERQANGVAGHMRRIVSLTAASIMLAVLVGGLCGDARGAEPPQTRAWRILEAGLRDNSLKRRIEAVRALALLPAHAEALRAARAALSDCRPAVRAAAASVLGQMASSDLIPELRQMLEDKDPSVVVAAANALRKLKDPTATEVYYELLTGERKCMDPLTTQAVETLHDHRKVAITGMEEGIGFIPYIGIAYSAGVVLKATDPTPVRAAAARALASDQDPRTGRALARASRDKSPIVRTAALTAIAERGNPDVLVDAVSGLSDKDTAVQNVAAAAVIRLSGVARSTGTMLTSSASTDTAHRSATPGQWIKGLPGDVRGLASSLEQ
jgi:HEAT repeat protein